MKHIRITIFIMVCFLAISAIAYSMSAENVETVNNEDYFPKVHELMQKAKKSIYVIMFSANYYDKYPDSPPNVLLNDLVNAKKKGLDVKIILEQENPSNIGFFTKKKIAPDNNERVMRYLKQNNVPCVLDAMDTVTHSKLILVDDEYTVIGSTNWSYSALTKNNETSVIIKSRETAKSYLAYFNKVMLSCAHEN